jgi:hypothetical protein
MFWNFGNVPTSSLPGGPGQVEAEKFGREGKFELLVSWLRQGRHPGIPGNVLRESGNAKAGELVIAMLDSSDSDIRVRAAATLGPLGAERAAAALCSILPKATDTNYATSAGRWGG